jgi:hypothetical protein
MGPIELQSSKINGGENFYDGAIRKLRQDDLLIEAWSPDNLRMELDKYPLWQDGQGQIRLKQLWDYLAQYCYLPRLSDHEVLIKAIRDGVSRLDAPFGYATGVSDQGYHTGLVFRSTGSIYFDEQSILVHPDYVVEPPVPASAVRGDLLDETSAISNAESVSQPVLSKVTSRYYGRAGIDPQRVNKDMGLIVEEVVERLTSLVGCNVEITIEINAHLPEGFDESIIRTVSENSKTLKFDTFGFENE